jgi:mRNA-degrading endonuclease RelE of RelBE toxin-antitoxin system
VRRIRALALDPEPPESEALPERWEGHRRLHVLGTLRVVYRVDHRARLIDVVKIGGRGSIYR